MDTNRDSLSNALLQSIELFAKKEANQVPATLTVEAKVVEVIDQGRGIYKVQYLGNSFEAVAANTNIIYDIDEMVYLIIPNGNFDNNKIILAPISAATTTYASTLDSNSYFALGDNLFASVDDVELCTYRPHDANPLGTDDSPYVSIDTSGFAELIQSALQDSRTLDFTCRIKTNIEKSRRTKGNYGLILDIPIKQEDRIKMFSVVLDINSLKGDSYNFSDYSLQNYYFSLPADAIYDTSRQPTIRSFVVDFIGEYSSEAPTDIWIKDIKLLSTSMIEKGSVSGYYLTLTASEGSSFLSSRTSDSKYITPILLLDGQQTKVDDFECYWFKENSLIDIQNEKYNSYGGYGWEILNNKVNTTTDSDGQEVYQYVTNEYSYLVNQTEIHSATNYKCVLVNNDIVIDSIITIKNLASTADIQLVSTNENNLYIENVGQAHLILRYYEDGITNTVNPNVNIKYAWQRYDRSGRYLDNNFYTIDRINEKVIIDNKIYFETEISFDVSNIDISNKIICTVYAETALTDSVSSIVIGTRTIELKTDTAKGYTIQLENGDKIYKYDVDGDSPLVADYDGPVSSAIKDIEPITIKLFKNDNIEFNTDEYAAVQVTWLIPINSMFGPSADFSWDTSINPGYYTSTGNYNTHKSLNYTIANVFDKNKSGANIIVRTSFKDIVVEDITKFNFIKDGESGLNGIKYSAVITYNNKGYGEDGHKLQLIYVASTDKWYSYNPAINALEELTYDHLITTFGVNLYANGELISTQTVNWKIFDDNYTYNDIRHPLQLSNNLLMLKPSSSSDAHWTNVNLNYCAIVEACCRAKRSTIDDSQTYSEEYVYAYYPIEMTYMANANYLQGILPTLNNGFAEVIYSIDGTNPQYDNSANFKVFSQNTDDDLIQFYNYNWSCSDGLTITTDISDKTGKATPASKFDNGAAKNYVKVNITASNDASSKLTQKISSLQSQITTLTNTSTYYSQLQNALSILYQFNYNSYVNSLSNASNLFLIKTNVIRILQELKIKLQNLLDQANIYYLQDMDQRIADLITEINTKITVVTNLLNLSYELGINANAITEIMATVPSSLLLSLISLQTGDKAYMITLSDAIKKYNFEITNVYIDYYNQLDANFINLQTIVQSVLNQLNTYVNDNRWTVLSGTYNNINEEQHLYLGLVTTLRKYIDSFSNVNNYSYDKIVNNILKPMQGAIAALEDINYTSKIIKLNNTIYDLQQKLTVYQGMVLPANNSSFVHIKPIIMLFNRDSMSGINGWDGNKIPVVDGYLTGTQLGAGINSNSGFSGIILGVKQTAVKNSSNQRIGLFGFNSGNQSLFLNARDGSAIFGKSGSGQIIIDPSQNKGLLYSSNFWVNYDPASGKPTNYNYSNEAHAGMLIDLTTPSIRFGNGRFSVDANGNMHAGGAGSGDVGGWYITDSTLYSGNYVSGQNGILLDSANNRIAFGSTSGQIYSGSHSGLNSTTDGFYLDHNGLSIGSKFYASKEGIVRIGYNAFDSGSSVKHWTINGSSSNSYISYATTSINKTINPNSNIQNVYIGTDGISLGEKLYIENTGELHCTGVDIVGTITATSGEIGAWRIEDITIARTTYPDCLISYADDIILNAGENATIPAIGFFGTVSGGYTWIHGDYGSSNTIFISNRIDQGPYGNGKLQCGGFTCSSITCSGNINVDSDKTIKIGDAKVATQSWVNDKDYATKTWVTNKNYATQSWINGQSFAHAGSYSVSVSVTVDPDTGTGIGSGTVHIT